MTAESDEATNASATTGVGSVTLGGATAVMRSTTAPVSASLVEPVASAGSQLAALSHDMGITHGPVVAFEGATADVAKGATITFTLPEPLDERSSGALAYWDAEANSWHAVPSVVAPDRRSISAQVDHFSPWTDFISDVTREVGSIFDARVDKPTCEGRPPDWVQPDGVVFVDDQNSPLLWCAGHDPAHPEILVVKVRVNRGYGIQIQSSVSPEWTWNSFLNVNALAVAKDVFKDAQGAASAALSVLLTGGQVAPGSTEVAFGFTEHQVRAAPRGGVALVSAKQPDLLQLVISMVVKQMADTTDNKVVAYAVALAGVTKCLSSVAKTRDATTAYKAFLECAEATKDVPLLNETQVASLGKYVKLSKEELASQSKAASKQFFAIVTLSNLFFQAATYVGDINFTESVRQISIFAKIQKPSVGPVTAESLKTADVEGAFGVSAGPLVDGMRESDTGGYIMLSPKPPPALGDFTGDGIPDGAAVMEGSSGAGGSYGWVSLFTNGRNFLGSWDGYDYTGVRSQIKATSIANQKIDVEWTAVDNNHPATNWRARLSWNGKEIVAENVEELPVEDGVGSDVVLGADGYGSLKIGMTEAEARSDEPSLGTTLKPSAGGCTSTSSGLGNVYFASNGRITVIDPSSDEVTTPQGLAAGDPLTMVLELYGPEPLYQDGRFLIPAPDSTTGARYAIQGKLAQGDAGEMPVFEGPQSLGDNTVTDIMVVGGSYCFN